MKLNKKLLKPALISYSLIMNDNYHSSDDIKCSNSIKSRYIEGRYITQLPIRIRKMRENQLVSYISLGWL